MHCTVLSITEFYMDQVCKPAIIIYVILDLLKNDNVLHQYSGLHVRLKITSIIVTELKNFISVNIILKVWIFLQFSKTIWVIQYKPFNQFIHIYFIF